MPLEEDKRNGVNNEGFEFDEQPLSELQDDKNSADQLKEISLRLQEEKPSVGSENNGTATIKNDGGKEFVEIDLQEIPKSKLEGEITLVHENSPSKQENEEIQQEDADFERDNWNHPLEFLFSCIAMSVGLGNIWRFPFVAYENGGGAFLIPYLIVLVFIGRPIYYLEMILGQFSSYGNIKVWSVCPIAKGIGYGQLIASACILSYYTVIMAISLFYLAMSFQSVLPWSVCGEWADERCVPIINDTSNTRMLNYFQGVIDKYEATTSQPEEKQSSAEQYFLRYVMHAVDPIIGIDDGVGKPDWKLVLCLIACWIAICLVLIRGVRSSGKVAYVMSLFPYVVLIVMLVQGSILEGAIDGVIFFIKPDWSKLYDPNVWFQAIGQSFFSLSVGTGGIIAYSSFNDFRHHINRDALIVSIVDTFTSLLGGFSTFAILGNLAYQLDRPVSKVVESGVGLTFITYPDALARFQAVPQLFSVLFFLMMLTLGIGSGMALANIIITAVSDHFPHIKRIIVTIAFCMAGVLAGLVYTTPGGLYVIDLVDFFGGNFLIYLMTLLEVIAITWIYGLRRFSLDIEFMVNHSVGLYWKICWAVVVPLFLTFVLVYTFAIWEVMTYGDHYTYSEQSMIGGWMITVFALLLFVIFGIHGVYKRKAKTWKEKFLHAWRPTSQWGPRNKLLNKQWRQRHIDRFGHVVNLDCE